MAARKPAKASARSKRSTRARQLASLLASAQGRRDETANVEVGQQVARDGDSAAMAALVELLDDREASADAIKAIYECGYAAPDLLVEHTDRFVRLLTSRKNRLVWGGMIALSCIGRAAPEAIWPHREAVFRAFDHGSVITRDAAIVTLAGVAQADAERARALLPWFVRVVSQARPKDLPRWADQILGVLAPTTAADVTTVIRQRMTEVSATSARRKLERRLARFEGQRP